MATSIVSIALVLAAAVGADAQAPAPAPTSPAAGQPTAPAPPADYAYDSESRRDPFVSLVNRGTDARSGAPRGTRPEGLGGVAVEELTVRGIVQTRDGYVAMIAAPSGRTYTVRPGDRLLDGSVRTINGQAVILMQEVNDPLSLEKQREVRKSLRGEVK